MQIPCAQWPRPLIDLNVMSKSKGPIRIAYRTVQVHISTRFRFQLFCRKKFCDFFPEKLKN